MRTAWWTWSLMIACRGCQACGEPLPADTADDTDAETDEPVDTDVVDTGPPPPCPNPEAEPNGLDAPNGLRLEELACGDFQAALDIDAWQFEVAEDDWLMVRIDARSFSSRADPGLVLSSARGGSAQVFARNDGFEDPMVLFPASAGTWTAMVIEETGSGGLDGYAYELLAGTAKAPVTWDTVDPDDNESRAEAAPLAFEDVLFGAIDTPGDADWYAFEVPVGKQALLLSIDAARWGSAGNFALSLFDASGAMVAQATSGLTGIERDPVLRYTSLGGEDLFVRVQESDGRSGEAYWYLLEGVLE